MCEREGEKEGEIRGRKGGERGRQGVVGREDLLSQRPTVQCSSCAVHHEKGCEREFSSGEDGSGQLQTAAEYEASRAHLLHPLPNKESGGGGHSKTVMTDKFRETQSGIGTCM